MIETIRIPGGAEEMHVVRSPLMASFPALRFGLSTRVGGVSRRPFDLNLSYRVGDDEPSVDANRARFFGALGVPLDRLAIPKQVHGDTVRVAPEPGTYEECDGLVTDMPEVYLVISVADCVPVFAFDPVKGALAAIHAGWRGCRLDVVTQGMEMLSSLYGSDPGDIRAVVGQSAGACCYEVGEEVASAFEERFVVRADGRKPRLDLHAHALDRLLCAGIKRSRIELLTSCTICHPEEFHSYRRERELSGRMMGVIGVNSPRPHAPA